MRGRRSKAAPSYFDLTEDVATSDAVAAIAESAAEGQIFMPQCGLAPGFISIVAYDLINWFERVETVKMRVGALPQFPTGELKYNLTWSTDGLINEYCNPCEAIHAGREDRRAAAGRAGAFLARRRALRGVQHERSVWARCAIRSSAKFAS